MNTHLRNLLILFVLGLALNGIVATITTQPGYVDAYYYYNGGTFIAQGEWVEPYVWNLVAPPPSLPTPAFGYWQPIPSILSAMGIRLFAFLPPYDAAQIPFVILAATLPLIAYFVALQIGDQRHAIFAGLLTVFSGFYVIYWSVTSTVTPFAVTGSLSLMFAGLGRRDVRWWYWFGAGACAALAHLTRADGVLLVLILIAAAMILRSNRFVIGRVADAGFAVGGYVLIMLPWWLRNLTVFGALQAPGGFGTLWAIHYNDLFHYPPDLSLQRYLAAGWNTIWQPKMEAFHLNTLRFVGELNLIFLLPFTLIGAGRRWRHDFMLPAILYGVSLFGAMTFAFTWPGMQGGWFHSAGALIPFVMVAAVLGIDDLVTWIGQRRRWRISEARIVFSAAAVVYAIGLTGYALRGIEQWNFRTSDYFGLREALDTLAVPEDAPTVVSMPPTLYYFTGRGGIPIPTNGGEELLLTAADDYGIDYVVIDTNTPDPLIHLLNGEPVSDRLERLGQHGRIVIYRINP